MHIRLKVPQELHAALKVEAATCGVTLEKLCVERLGNGGSHVEAPKALPSGGDSEPAMKYTGQVGSANTRESPSGNETAGEDFIAPEAQAVIRGIFTPANEKLG